MANYEVYVCSYQASCFTLKRFEASSDSDAAELARIAMDTYEKETDDYIYREYLKRIENGEEIDLPI